MGESDIDGVVEHLTKVLTDLVAKANQEYRSYAETASIVLELELELVLDLLGFCAERRAGLPGNYFVPLCEGENSRRTTTRTRTTS